MNQEQALKVLTDVCAKFVGNLADHQAIQVALKTITDCLNDKGQKDVVQPENNP